MINATIFTRAFERNSEKYNKFKEFMGDRFIDIVDFPDGVPIAWQDKKLKLTGKDEPTCDMVQAKFGIRNTDELDMVVNVMRPEFGMNLKNTQPPSFWDEKISKEFNE